MRPSRLAGRQPGRQVPGAANFLAQIYDPKLGLEYFGSMNQWIGLRENLQETIDFPIKYGVFP